MAEKNLYLSKDMGGIPEDQVCLGYVSGVFGIRGELRIFLHNPESRFLFSPQDVFLIDSKNVSTSFRLCVRTGAGKKIIGKIEGIQTPEEAHEKIQHKITVLKKNLPDLVEDEWYHHQLLGMKVHTESGEFLGTIVEIVPAETEIWVCEGEGQTVYIPYTDEDVISVSLETGVIVPDE